MRLRNYTGRIALPRKILKQHLAIAGQLFGESSNQVDDSMQEASEQKNSVISLSSTKLSG